MVDFKWRPTGRDAHVGLRHVRVASAVTDTPQGAAERQAEQLQLSEVNIFAYVLPQNVVASSYWL